MNFALQFTLQTKTRFSIQNIQLSVCQGYFTFINIGFWQGPFPKSGLDKMLVFPMIGFGSFSFVEILWVFSVFCLLCLCAHPFICALWSPAGKGLTSWLSFVVSNCEFVIFSLVSWVRCGTWLYRFLIFAHLLTSTVHDT